MADGSPVQGREALNAEADAAINGKSHLAAVAVDGKEPEDGEAAAAPADAHAAPGEAEAPLDPPFAQLTPPLLFWQDVGVLTVLGAAAGCFGWAYLKAISAVTKAFMAADGRGGYPDVATLGFGSGRWWWILVLAGAGLVVGLARALLGLEQAPSFITELRSMHADPIVGSKQTVIALLGLMAGVPMGPEAGMGAAAGAVAMWLGAFMRRFRHHSDTRRRVYVLSAMCSLFSAFLPNPMVAVLMTVELARPTAALGMTLVHLVMILAFGATASFAVYYAIGAYSYYKPIEFENAVVSGSYDQLYLPQGILIGILGAAFGLVYILIMGVVKLVAGKLRARLDACIGHWPRVVVMTTAGGAAIGALGWAMPLVLTDGSEQLATVFGDGAELGSSVLAASAFAKAFAYHLAAESGFAGGLFLPMLSMSSCLGRVFVNITGVNESVALSCAFVALAASLIPAPFMLALMANSVLLLGPQGLVPIFATVVTSHLLLVGVGVPQALLARSLARKEAKAKAAAAAGAAAEEQGAAV